MLLSLVIHSCDQTLYSHARHVTFIPILIFDNYTVVQIYMKICACIYISLFSIQEHEKRVWSLSYNSYDSALIATGGDDCSLKLWDLTKPHSIRSQPTQANVCSVRFQPGNRYNLAYGGAGKYSLPDSSFPWFLILSYLHISINLVSNDSLFQ